MSVENQDQKGLPVNLYGWNPVTEQWEKLPTSYIYSDYELSDLDAAGVTKYYGYVAQNQNWYIEKVTDIAVRFKKGSGDYVTNWTNRADPPYSYYFELTW